MLVRACYSDNRSFLFFVDPNPSYNRIIKVYDSFSDTRVKPSFSSSSAIEIKRIETINITGGKYCKSENLVRDGLRHNKHGDIQKFECRDCKRYFTINIAFETMKHNPQGITTAMQLYFSGESLRNVAHSLKLIGVEVSHQTIYNWIDKYTALMNKYLDKITPKISTS